MNLNETTKTRTPSLSFLSLSLAVGAIFIGGVLYTSLSHRQYFPAKTIAKDDDMGAKEMGQYFFAARRNISTNAMDYQSMLAADIADRAMNNARKTHHSVTAAGLNFTWNSMGPTNIGGRTRAILIDNTDPTHQTIFAGGVSGGIWKSTNGGVTWDNADAELSYSLNDTLSNINVCSIAQDVNGAIYIGTGEGFSVNGYPNGEGFSTGILGGGMYKSTNDGATWRLLPKTVPASTNNSSIAWTYINRIAIRPDSFQVIYAATNNGLMVSHDSGATWNYAINATTGHTLPYLSYDVKISGDGSVVVACVNGSGYYCYPQSGNSNAFTIMKSTGSGRIPLNASRIEFAISPTDPNRIYASDIASNGIFGTGGGSSGIYMTIDAKTAGGHWYNIGPGGTIAFDPYAEPSTTTDDQSTYDNTLGVPPANEAQVLCGGTTLWEWSGSSLTDTVGSWEKISHYSPYYAGDPLWIHADEHAIVFDQNNPQTVYIGCDGGIFKCSNLYIDPAVGSTESSIAALDIQPINRNYDVTQYYSICFSPEVNYDTLTNGSSSRIVVGFGLGGGTQDNGSPYINGLATHYPYDATDMSGGDGAGSVVSSLTPNIAYFCSDDGSLLREGNLGALSYPTSAYNATAGYNLGADIDSVQGAAAAAGEICFVFPVALYENAYDTLNHDSLLYVATQNDTIGQTIWPLADNGPTSYPYVLTKAVANGASITVPDRVVSRLAIGFSGSTGVWMNGQGASNNAVVWMPIAGPLSKPTAFTGSSPVHCLTWAPDGDALYVGTEGGTLFRFTNINTIIANNYKSGALFSNAGALGTKDTTNQVISTNLTFAALGSRDILSIAVDPNNKNNMMVTLGNYGATDYVYYTDSALGVNPVFTAVQGTGVNALPSMPVYSSILDVLDSTSHYVTNSAMVATEHGIYTTSNINAGAATKWTKTNSGMANVMTLAIKQQITKPWLCNNSGVIYAGTHGRGAWAASDNYNAATAVPQITAPTALNSLLVYPNPMTNQGNISYTLGATDNVTITIYDMQGKEMKTINMGQQSSGSHTVSFESSSLSAGTYFAALSGSNFRKVGKFIVVK